MESNEVDFEFNAETDRGYCNLCKVELTSAAHAQQHLQGKKHEKEKKKQRTISAFTRSASSGSVPATSEEKRGAEAGSSTGMLEGGGDVHDAPLIDFSDGTNQAAAAGGGGAAAMVGPGGDAGATSKTMTSLNPDEEMLRDPSGQVWYKCVPCNRPLNTLEQLRIHQQSPRHQKNAAKPKPSVVAFPVTTPGINAKNAGTPDQSGLMTDSGGDVPDAAQNDTVFIDGQIWYRCHACNCNVNTREQLRIHQQSPKHKKAVEGAVLARTGSGSTGAVQGLGMDRTVWHTCQICNKKVNTLQQLSIHMRSHGRTAGSATINSPPGSTTVNNRTINSPPTPAVQGLGIDRTVWHTCQVCNKKLNSAQQLSTHMNSHTRAAAGITINSPPGSTVKNRTINSPPGIAASNRTINSPPGIAASNWTINSPPGIAAGTRTIDSPPGPAVTNRTSGATSGLSFDKFLPFKGNIDDIQVVPAGTPLKQHFMEQERRRNSSSGGSEQSPGREKPPRLDRSPDRSQASLVQREPPRQRDRTTDGSDESPGRQSLSPGISITKAATAQPDDVDAARKKEEEGIDGVLVRLDDRDELSSGYHGNTQRVVTDGGARAAADGLTAQMGRLSLSSPDAPKAPSPAAPFDPDDPIRAPCAWPPCVYHCWVCDTHLSGPSPKIDHMDSSKHIKNLMKRGMLGAASLGRGGGGGAGLVSDGLIRISQKPISPNTPEGYYNYCDICNVPFSGPEAQAAHERGKQHKARATKSSQAPVRNLPGIVKHPCRGDSTDSYVLTKTEPRGYQVELYMKAMAADSVIFLPTGTGKTLVSVMVIAKMLKENPSRPVVFLVDRVLLVLQQAEVIRRQLDGEIFIRQDSANSTLEGRLLRIAALCGDQQDSEDTAGVPLYQHDVIVITADYYRNLLAEGSLFWEDNCLVVFDEAHHCTKNHPFNVLLQERHLVLPVERRPKVLGLTASPAGKGTLAQTQEMLARLLQNMGGIHVQAVEECAEELERHRSAAQIHIRELVRHPDEETLVQALVTNMDLCCKMILDDPEMKFRGGAVPKALQDISNNVAVFGKPDGGNMAELSDRLEEILRENKDKLKATAETIGGKVRSLWSHLADIINVHFDLEELGFDLALRHLSNLKEDLIGGFGDVEAHGVSYETLRRVMADHVINVGGATSDGFLTKKQCLVNAIETVVDWKEGKHKEDKRDWPMALVLVRRREYAMTLTDWLESCDAIRGLDLKVTRLVGHGAGKSDGGMTVKQQEKILANIREHKYDVIVATSVAEEGLDIPECELIVQLDPPTTITALVQVRGRARKRGSHYILVCRSHDQAEELRDLMRREEHMIRAVGEAITRQRDRAGF